MSSPRPFRFEAEPCLALPRGVLVRLAGPLDATTAFRLDSGLEPLRRAGFIRFLIDFAEVAYLNSICDGILIRLAENARAQGGGVVLFDVPRGVGMMFEMWGIASILPHRPDLESAIAFLAGHE